VISQSRYRMNMLSSCKGYCEKWAAGGTPVASFDIDESEVFS